MFSSNCSEFNCFFFLVQYWQRLVLYKSWIKKTLQNTLGKTDEPQQPYRSTFDSEMLKDSEKVCFYNKFKLRQSLISCEKSIEWLSVSTETLWLFEVEWYALVLNGRCWLFTLVIHLDLACKLEGFDWKSKEDLWMFFYFLIIFLKNVI